MSRTFRRSSLPLFAAVYVGENVFKRECLKGRG